MDSARRRFLQTVATVTAGAVAGCQTGGNGTATETPGDETTNGDGTATPGDETPAPDDETPTDDVDPAELKDRARSFVQLLADGEFESAHDRLTERSASDISVDGLRTAWQQTAGRKGELEEITDSSYEGESSTGVHEVVLRARFTEGTQQFNFALTTDAVASFRIVPDESAEWTPPAYVDESAFSERDVTLSAPGDCSLGATLSVPEGSDTVLGVVLVHGNGAQDRDETIGPNKTFKDVAWGLASRGIAVLRYDKRTHACDVDRADATIDDIVTDDALTAIDRLRSVDQVSSVFVAGHSFGGGLAPRIANRDGNLAGIVMLAPGPARPFADTIVDQTRHLAEVDGTVTDAEQQQIAQVEQTAQRVRELDIGDDEVVFNFGGDEYYRTLQEYDKKQAIRSLSIPRYIAQGSEDWQVTVEDDLAIWRDAVEGESNVTIEVYEGLNHHFQESTGDQTTAEYTIPDSHVARRVVEDVATFVTSNA